MEIDPIATANSQTANSQARAIMGDYNWTNESETRAFDTDALTEPSMHLDSSQGQERCKEDNSTPTNHHKHYSKTTHTEEQATEQPSCQQTKQDSWSPAWYSKDLENTGKTISTHGTSSQGPRTMLIIHEEPTKTASRSGGH